MTDAALFWIAVVGLLVTGFAAAGARVLREFSVSELEDYCRRRNRRDRFSHILDEHEDAALAAESLQIVGAAALLFAGTLYFFDGLSESPSQVSAAGFWLGVLVATLALLTVTAWIPWAVVRVWETPFLFHTWRLWRIAAVVGYPLIVAAKMVDELMRRLANQPREDEEDEEEAFQDEVLSMVAAGTHDGYLEEEARDMIEGVIELGEVDVSEIMTPRSEVDAIDILSSWDHILARVIDSGRTRMPVYENSLDEIIGVLYAKDLLPELSRPSEQRRPIREILRPARFVPLTMGVDELLRGFRSERSHLAVVVDEYQAVCGVVTIEDALEEIVGEIVDESDKDETPGEIEWIDEHVCEALGRAHVEDLNEECGFELPESDDYDTVGGLVVHRLGAIPQPGAQVDWDGLRIIVLEASRRRVERVRIERTLS